MVALVPIARYYNPSIEVSMVGISSLFTNGEGLTMSFEVERTLTSTPDTCKVSICGLDPVRAQAMGALFLATGTSKISVRFGYDGILGGLFVGDVRDFVSQRRAGDDVWTDATADDGGQSYSDAVIRPPQSNVAQTAEQTIRIAAAYMELIVSPQAEAVIAATEPGPAGPYTSVFSGKASELMDAVCRRINCRWWIRDTQLFLTRLGAPDSTRPAVLVFPQVLVGDVSTGGSGEIALPMFCDPNVVPGGQVSYLGTRFRVERVVHSGASRNALCVSMVNGRAL